VRPIGAGESGKSTVLKQMKLIYAQGFSKNEKLEWKPVIFSNIIQSFKTIHEAMVELNIQFEYPENEVSHIPASSAGTAPRVHAFQVTLFCPGGRGQHVDM
jgi:G-protein alpha subunit